MRWIVFALCSAALLTSALAADVEFVRVWPQWKGADAFDRIGEYFGRPENDGREIVLRTHPEQRAGLYFLVRAKSPAALDNAKFILEVIRPDAPDTRIYTFPVSIPAKGRVFELGLTDSDWPGGRTVHPVAWNLTLLDAGGNRIATQHSYLWAKPPQ